MNYAKTDAERIEILNQIAAALENGAEFSKGEFKTDIDCLQVRARIYGAAGFDIVSYFVLPSGRIFAQYYAEDRNGELNQVCSASLPGVSSVVPHFEKTTGRVLYGVGS